MADILQVAFSTAFCWKKMFLFLILIPISLKFVPKSPIDNNVALVKIIAGWAPNRRQDISWANADPIQWYMYMRHVVTIREQTSWSPFY